MKLSAFMKQECPMIREERTGRLARDNSVHTDKDPEWKVTLLNWSNASDKGWDKKSLSRETLPREVIEFSPISISFNWGNAEIINVLTLVKALSPILKNSSFCKSNSEFSSHYVPWMISFSTPDNTLSPKTTWINAENESPDKSSVLIVVNDFNSLTMMMNSFRIGVSNKK